MPLTSFASCPSASPQPVSPLPTTNGADENRENCKKNVTKEPPVIIVDDSQQKVIDSQQKEIDSQQKAIDDLKRQIEQYKTNEKQMNRYYNTSDKLIFGTSRNNGGNLGFWGVLNSFRWWNRVLNNCWVPWGMGSSGTPWNPYIH